jgi:hypothetical protein
LRSLVLTIFIAEKARLVGYELSIFFLFLSKKESFLLILFMVQHKIKTYIVKKFDNFSGTAKNKKYKKI